MLVDTHCHLNFNQYDEDRDTVVQRAIDAGVTRIIVPAIDIPTIPQVIKLTKKYPGVFAAVGVHPTSTADFNDSMLAEVRANATHDKIVAIGEIGLDYYWDKSPKEKQIHALEGQLDIATEFELPVIIHNRESSNDLMDVLESWVKTIPESLKDRPGVLHSFSAPPDIAERALAAGFYLGFTGPITFKKAEELRHVAAMTPLDRILVETDGPFLTPHPYRGKRNESAYIPYIAERLASVKQVTPEHIAQATTDNAERLFKLPPTQ